MKKIFSFLLLATVIGVIGTGCGGSMSSAGPKEVLVAFFEKLSKKDIDGAAELATKDSKTTMDMMKKAFAAAEKMKDMKDAKDEDPAEEFKNMEIGDAKINGDAATVAVKNKKKDTEVEFPLKKEGGAWKVDFSMATLMQMGMNERNRRANAGEETAPGMENFDSASVKKGLEMMDSALKKVDPKKLEETMKALEKLKQPQ